MATGFLPWSADPVISERCVNRIREVAMLNDTQERHRRALQYIKDFATNPMEVGNISEAYMSALAAHALDPTLLKE